MISRRQFTKTLGGAVTLTAIKPDALWSGEPTVTVMPASVSPVAAELYRRALVIDGDVLGEIGFPISTDELVTDALLKRGYKSAAVEKILGGNFKRVFADIWSP